MKKKVIVLGSGMVGRLIAHYLSLNYEVTAVDVRTENLSRIKRPEINKVLANLSSESVLTDLISGFDLVIGALPGILGYKTLKSVISAGKSIVDISFFPEDVFELDELAKEKKVTAVFDCGIGPGLSNMIIGHHASRLDINLAKCYVGGLPFIREFPFEYKAPFSPADVLEEYLRPARVIENGKLIIRQALSGLEHIDDPEVGTLEAFYTDGLRSLIKTMKIPTLIEKTLRYPGHAMFIRALIETGFLNQDEIEIGKIKLKPIDFTSELLFRKWELKDEDDEFTVMYIYIEGVEEARKVSLNYRIFDRRDKASGFSSMSRTTGLPAVAVARLILEGDFDQIGIIPPEYIGASEKCFNIVMNEVKSHGINIACKKT